MSVPRRSSNNPFSDSLSPESTGSTHQSTSTPPLYPSENSNNQYYNSNEKSRSRRQEGRTTDDLPPSYEEAAGPKAAKSSYPREKEGSSSSRPHRTQSESDRHRTRVHREWPGDGSTNGSSKPHRSGETRSSSHRHREHKSEHKGDREHRSHRSHRSGEEGSKSRHRSSSTKHKKDGAPKPKNVDTIDKLDVTGLFGGTFHHDGPFDACTPQRNKNQKSAPVLAFPADGPNNSIKGKAPESTKDSTIDYVMGRSTDYGDDDLYTTSVSPRKPTPLLAQYNGDANQSQSTIAAVKNTENITQFDTNKKATPVHGQTTLGLGSSTFLDGAPAASQTAYEEAEQRANIGGLNRKKSLKQKFRDTSGGSAGADEDEPIRFSPDKSESSGGNSLLKRVRSLKVGRSKS
ncbi:unnamed protein product [Wickerhamomyces anomalus]